MFDRRPDERARRRLSYANVMSTIAVFGVLGGGAWAAQKIGTNDLRNSSVTSAKIKNKAVASKDLKPSARPFPATLPRGVTLRGTFYAGYQAGSAGQNAFDSISFGHTLASAPEVHFVRLGQPAPAECPGTVANPEARPGTLCYYVRAAPNAVEPYACAPHQYSECGQGVFGASKSGSVVWSNSEAAGDFRVLGSWAVTAP